MNINVRVDHYLHISNESDIMNKILALSQDTNRRIKSMGTELDNMKAGLDTLEAEVAGIATVEASAEATLAALVAKANDLQAQLQAAIDAGNPAEIQAAADRLAAQNQALDATKTALAAAIANIPA